MARIASNPLSVPRFRPYFQVSDTALLFKSPSLPPYRTPKFQSIICHTNPLPTQTQSSDEVPTSITESKFRIIDAFRGKIMSEVEDTIIKKIKEGIIKLDSLLQSLPKQLQVNSIVALNVTFMDDPLFTNSSVELEINGLFNRADEISVSNYYSKRARNFLSCNGFCLDCAISFVSWHLLCLTVSYDVL
ncbi:putative BPI/LBP family protein At1g04970 isoform X1 [Gossypium arboreum]|uniref:putative BPI/LBP family protein At1g04970 isoform X1 n=1 Tax=Gossypium arboreum TaxID=29729 RepID=UPI0022F19FB5|nr:putative BPI/LBP family protein At1g04970 isoform X1 [Gossypium arboreum]